MQEKTSSIKCFKCLGRGNIASQCPTKKTMIMRGQDIYSSQDEITTSPSSSESEEAKGEESSEEIDSQEERDLVNWIDVFKLLGGQSCDLVNWIDAIKLHLYCCYIFFLHPYFCVFPHSFIVAYKLFKKQIELGVFSLTKKNRKVKRLEQCI